MKVSSLFDLANGRICGILKRRQEACGGRCNVGSVDPEVPKVRKTIHQGLGVQQDPSEFYNLTLLTLVRQMPIDILLYLPAINHWIRPFR